jgi:hypothetical protein
MPRERFHHELRALEDAVIQMGAIVECEIAHTMQALTCSHAGASVGAAGQSQWLVMAP